MSKNFRTTPACAFFDSIRESTNRAVTERCHTRMDHPVDPHCEPGRRTSEWRSVVLSHTWAFRMCGGMGSGTVTDALKTEAFETTDMSTIRPRKIGRTEGRVSLSNVNGRVHGRPPPFCRTPHTMRAPPNTPYPVIVKLPYNGGDRPSAQHFA